MRDSIIQSYPLPSLGRYCIPRATFEKECSNAGLAENKCNTDADRAGADNAYIELAIQDVAAGQH
jgi:hypothetical protein